MLKFYRGPREQNILNGRGSQRVNIAILVFILFFQKIRFYTE